MASGEDPFEGLFRDEKPREAARPREDHAAWSPPAGGHPASGNPRSRDTGRRGAPQAGGSAAPGRRAAAGGAVGPPRGSGSGGTPPRPRNWRRIIAQTLGSVLSFTILITAGVAWYLLDDLRNSLTTSNALDQVGGPRSTNGTVNILLMGLDSRYSLDDTPLPPAFLDALHVGSNSDVGGNNTNTLILMHIPANGKVTAFSIPRDDWVNAPGLGMIKIKQAYGLAKANEESTLVSQGVTDHETLVQKSRDAGLAETIKTVEAFTGAPIDHFGLVNLDSFYNIANALGGVQVCLLHPVDDQAFSGAVFPAGVQTLNAVQSVEFVRQRHGLPNGDLDRTHRQQAFLAGVTKKLGQEGVFTDFGKLQSLLNVVKTDVVIDSGWDVLSFINQAQDLTGGNVQFYTLPIKGYATEQGQDVNLVDPVQIQAIVQAAFNGSPSSSPTAATTTAAARAAAPPPPPAVNPATVAVSVQNGTGTSGLAQSVSTYLVGKGFTQAANGGDYPGGSLTTTTLTYPSGAQAQAQAVATALGLPSGALQVNPAVSGITLAIGADYGSTTTFVPAGSAASATAAPDAASSAAPSAASSASAGASASPSIGVIPTTGPQGSGVKEGGIPCVN